MKVNKTSWETCEAMVIDMIGLGFRFGFIALIWVFLPVLVFIGGLIEFVAYVKKELEMMFDNRDRIYNRRILALIMLICTAAVFVDGLIGLVAYAKKDLDSQRSADLEMMMDHRDQIYNPL